MLAPLYSNMVLSSPNKLLGLKTVRVKAHAGSNPAPSAIKETSLVYQGKRGFFINSMIEKGEHICYN